LNGGWHYSFLGSPENIKEKLEAYAETQTNNKTIKNDEHILNCLKTGNDLFGRDDDWRCAKKFVSLEEMGHPGIKEWLKKYPQYVKEI